MPTQNMKKLILIVDDSKDIRNVYSQFLREEGFLIVSATDGQDALEKAVKFQPDLILMDLSLPGIGGWAAIQRLKKSEETKHIPVVILTAHSLDGANTIIKEGCEGFLIKPSLPDDLLREVVRVLQHPARVRLSARSKGGTPTKSVPFDV